jgi:RecA/RadA recombinase
MESNLIKNLRSNPDNDDLFDCNATVISYKTGIPVLDYYIGYYVNVYDENDNLVDQYPSLGIAAGSNNTFVGKPSTGKTTAAIGIAANIVRPFNNGLVIHYDLEQATSYTRVANVTKFNRTELYNKYILRQEKTSLEEIKLSIMHLYKEKMDNIKDYLYDTGKRNEFNEPIIIPEPTVVIIDSLATLSNYINYDTKDGSKRADTIGTQTEVMRFAGELGRFYKELLPCLRTANIIIIAINQLRDAPQLAIPKPAEILGMKQDEATPGGKAPKFYAHTFLKFESIGKDKFTKDVDGFSGFATNVTIIKARTNSALRQFKLIYDTEKGMDSVRSSVEYAKDNGLLGGNKNGYYFLDHKDQKFTRENMLKDFRENRELYKIMYSTITPLLEEVLSKVEEEDKVVCPEEMDY